MNKEYEITITISQEEMDCLMGKSKARLGNEEHIAFKRGAEIRIANKVIVKYLQMNPPGKNYIMIDGKQIPLSNESVEKLKEALGWFY